MRGRKAVSAFLIPVFSLLAAVPASAHQPRLVGSSATVEVRKPETSQAFYAELAGSPQAYVIRSDVPFRLYVNLLVPDIPAVETDVEAVITRGPGPDREVVARLEGRGFGWRAFFEPFGGDRYLLGPEYDAQVPAGTYIVAVSSPDNRGKYALAIGKAEKFPPGEMLRTLVALPKLKRFFGKSPWAAYFNLSGLFLLFVITATLGAAALILFVSRRRRAGAGKAGTPPRLSGGAP